jgi:hypothetical protein
MNKDVIFYNMHSKFVELFNFLSKDSSPFSYGTGTHIVFNNKKN